MLDKANRHSLLERTDNTSNSFIANINLLATKYEDLKSLDGKFTNDILDLLSKLVSKNFDLDLASVATDLDKGSYNGFRKLDINLLKNFANYNDEMTAEEKREMWNTAANMVYYDSITITLDDKTTISKTFSEIICNHHQLYDQLADWDLFKTKVEGTAFNIVPSEGIQNHELLRLYDSTLAGSNIAYIQLHVAPQGQNQQYDAEFAGAKSYYPEYSWMDTTSALITIANQVNDIMNTSDYVKKTGDTYVSDMTSLHDQTEQYANDANDSKVAALKALSDMLAAIDKQNKLTVTSDTVDVNRDPAVSYDGEANVLNFQLPRSEVALVDLTHFAIDEINGHLSLNLVNDSDVSSVVMNDEGNIIITLNKS